MYRIPLGKGLFAIVDDIDCDLVFCHSWCYNKKTGQIFATIKGVLVKLHEVVAKRMRISGEVIDHKDRDKLNNTRSNLRAATQYQNLQNSCISKANTTGYRGVHWNKVNRTWFARIKIHGVITHLGTFELLEDAITARIAAEKIHHGEFYSGANENRTTETSLSKSLLLADI